MTRAYDVLGGGVPERKGQLCPLSGLRNMPHVSHKRGWSSDKLCTALYRMKNARDPISAHASLWGWAATVNLINFDQPHLDW